MSVEWHFLITLNEQLRPLNDPVAIQEVAVRLIGEHLHASRVNYAHIDGDEFVISRSFADGIQPFAGRSRVARFGEAIVSACRRGETVAVDDINTDPRLTEAEREHFLAGQIAAFIGAPLIKDGRWLATFSVHSATPRTWTRDQIALVEVTAERTWSAGERARAEEALGRSENRQAFLRRLTDTVSQFADPSLILHETCRLLGTHLRVNRVIYGEVDGDDCIILDDYVDGVRSMAGHVQWRNLAGSRTTDILKGWTLSVDDTSTGSHTPESVRRWRRRPSGPTSVRCSSGADVSSARSAFTAVRRARGRPTRLLSFRKSPTGSGRCSSIGRRKPGCARTKSGWRFFSG